MRAFFFPAEAIDLNVTVSSTPKSTKHGRTGSWLAIAACFRGGFIALLVAAAANGREIEFNRDVRPILSDKCHHCHGPDSADRAADLRLDVEADAKEDLGGYRVIDVESPDDSELLLRIEGDDEDYVMPPPDSHKELTAEERQTIRDWIEAGADWELPWAYVSPKRFTPPEVTPAAWSASWIDHFVLARLNEEGITPSPETDPITLVRRLHFDLTGLPPKPEVVAEFVADPSPEAYERLVDQLLGSPAYGERMAIYWLDLVRYADTVGYHGDQTITVWPYRDYVIHTFNENKPFDAFTAEQLAGDLLPESSIDDKIASAYNRLLQTTHEGGAQLKEYRAIYLADRVQNVSQVWMGATMGCAQCHDHKFDPLSSEEFYALGAFFADIEDEKHLRDQYGDRNRNPTLREPQMPVTSVYQRQRLERINVALTALDPKQDAEAITVLQAERDKAATESDLVISKSSEPRVVRVQHRGDWQDESGKVVEPRAPEALGWQTAEDERATRLDLAEWLTNSETGAGGLTARVMANRFWYLMFGEGIATVLDDFGGQGQPPTHPELLDTLAVEFVESGWDVKHLMKLIAMSRTYRQSSLTSPELAERDPYNRLLARQARFRLPAEAVRDTTLAVSDLLVGGIGGPSARPYQPAGYYKHLNFPQRQYVADTDRNQWRRGLYVHWQRQYLQPMMKAFDAPTREVCTAKRARSNTPLASLTLLNDPTFVEAARHLATRIVAEENGEPDEQADNRIGALYRRALSREPDAFERQQLAALVASQSAYYAAHPNETEALLGVGLTETPADDDEAHRAELAAWTFAARTVLNLSETLTRN